MVWIPFFLTGIVFIMFVLTNFNILRPCWDFNLKICGKTYFIWTIFCEKYFAIFLNFGKIHENLFRDIRQFLHLQKIYPLKDFWTDIPRKFISQKFLSILLLISLFLYFNYFFFFSDIWLFSVYFNWTEVLLNGFYSINGWRALFFPR